MTEEELNKAAALKMGWTVEINGKVERWKLGDTFGETRFDPPPFASQVEWAWRIVEENRYTLTPGILGGWCVHKENQITKGKTMPLAVCQALTEFVCD